MSWFGCAADLPGAGANTETPSFVSTFPEEGAQLVSSLSPIEATASEELDPDSVNDETVQVFWIADTRALRGDVTVVDAKTVQFVPEFAYKMRTDSTHFELRIDGVKTKAGVALESFVLRFESPYRRMLRSVNHGLGDPSAIEDYTAFEYGDQGLARRLSYDGPGGNGIWFDEDDDLKSYILYTYSDDGRRSESFNAPGANGTWFNDDDERSSISVRQSTEVGVQRSVSMAKGDDEILGTDDDVDATTSDYQHDAFGRQTLFTSGNAGADGLAFTEDDETNYTWSNNYDDEAEQQTRYRIGDPGVDLIWGTEDDVISTYNVYDLNASGSQLNYRSFTGIGADNDWLTDDDEMASFWDYEYSDVGLRTGLFIRIKGDDGVWDSDDDGYNYYYRSTYSDAGLIERRTRYQSPGSDSDWFTDDDLTDYYEEF